MRVRCWFISGINGRTWTYLALNKPKVIVMGNGYDVLGCWDVIVTFLLAR